MKIKVTKELLNALRSTTTWAGTVPKSAGYPTPVLDYFKNYLKQKYNLVKVRDLIGVTIERDDYETMKRIGAAHQRSKENERGRVPYIARSKKQDQLDGPLSDIEDKHFYASREWRELRAEILDRHSAECMQCGRSKKLHNVVIHVDHIIPRSISPELSLKINNLQILCEDCNIGKSNRYAVDYRPTDLDDAKTP
tara:strand:- start:103 stop:687 length:585 start_codon:yes stop_codon:yes gene_type:complete